MIYNTLGYRTRWMALYDHETANSISESLVKRGNRNESTQLIIAHRMMIQGNLRAGLQGRIFKRSATRRRLIADMIGTTLPITILLISTVIASAKPPESQDCTPTFNYCAQKQNGRVKLMKIQSLRL